MAEKTAALQAQIDELKQQISELRGTRPAPAATPQEPVELTRRGILGKAAAVAVGAAGGSLLLERPAAAANGGNLLIGSVNSGTTGTALSTPLSASNKVSLLVQDDPGFTIGDSAVQTVVGAWTSGSNTSFYGFSNSGIGARLDAGTFGLEVGASSGVTLRSFGGHTPTSGTHSVGEYAFASSRGSVTTCIIGGTPGTWANVGFNNLTGNGRLLDSRNGTGTAKAKFTSGTKRDVLVHGAASIPDAASVRAVAYSITVNSPAAGGYLKLGPKGGSQATVVNYTKGVSISASGITGLDDAGKMSITLYGGSADVVVDLTGYFV